MTEVTATCTHPQRVDVRQIQDPPWVTRELCTRCSAEILTSEGGPAMTAATLTLTEFLLARIAEDEAAAGRAGSFTPWDETFQNDDYGHLTVQPSRILAECEAKRRIVEWAAPILTNWPSAPEGFRYVSDDGLDLLKLLALPHADHPDFRDEWRP